MTDKARMMTFLLVVLTVWTLMHVYVFSRLWNLPPAPGRAWHWSLIAAGITLWISFPLAQILGRAIGRAAWPLEFVGATWMGVLFLMLMALFAADVVTGFGWLLPAASRPARLVAVTVAGALSLLALVQAARPPVIREHVVEIGNLRREHDGLRIVQLSDLHVGPLLGRGWLEGRLAQVAALRPDLIVVTGDLVEQDAALAVPLAPTLARLSAPLGVWGVTGNHEFYAGFEQSLAVFRESGITVLRDASREIAPGLVLAGVDDLTARRQFGLDGQPVERVLGSRPEGTTIYLCHSPWEVERAAELGADLMLSGHTHDGQIWPFTYFVSLVYPKVAGRYEVNGMTLIVSRGTGFWGPPMRLFNRSEIVAITLSRS